MAKMTPATPTIPAPIPPTTAPVLNELEEVEVADATAPELVTDAARLGVMTTVAVAFLVTTALAVVVADEVA